MARIGVSGPIRCGRAAGWASGRRDSAHGTWVSRRALPWRRACCCRRSAAGNPVHVRTMASVGGAMVAGGAAAAGARGARAGRLPGGCWRMAACAHAQARAYSPACARVQARAWVSACAQQPQGALPAQPAAAGARGARAMHVHARVSGQESTARARTPACGCVCVCSCAHVLRVPVRAGERACVGAMTRTSEHANSV